MTGWFAIETAGGSPGAVAVVRVRTDDTAALTSLLGWAPIPVGGASVRDVLGIDAALVARPDERTVLVMPHGGAAIVRAVAEGFAGLGLRHEPDTGGDGFDNPHRRFPEASDQIEVRMLAALARAASPLAIDLLLDQPGRWVKHNPGGPLADSRVLNRLIDPPVVATMGATNIGKSSLLNAVAGASVALAFDRPGTTRDAVGVLVDLAGLVVRWVDTPGVENANAPITRIIESEVAGADLVLRCVDAGTQAPPWAGDAPALTVATRADRAGQAPRADAVTSAATGQGLTNLVRLVRDTLVPPAAMQDQRPWRFWA